MHVGTIPRLYSQKRVGSVPELDDCASEGGSSLMCWCLVTGSMRSSDYEQPYSGFAGALTDQPPAQETVMQAIMAPHHHMRVPKGGWAGRHYCLMSSSSAIR